MKLGWYSHSSAGGSGGAGGSQPSWGRRPGRRTRTTGAGVLLLGLLAGFGAVPPASADAPPPVWTNERILDCDGEIVHTYLAPPGFGTPFNVVDSTEVIIPKLVKVVLPNGQGPFVTMNVPGFDPARKSTVHCSYVDPIGLQVEFWGLRK